MNIKKKLAKISAINKGADPDWSDSEEVDQEKGQRKR